MTGKLEILLKNKKIGLNYETLDKIEAGVSLYGFEVKSLKDRTGSINEAYVSIKDGEAWLLNAHIPSYQPKNTPASFDPYRPRKLLLSKKQILDWAQKIKQSNLTIMPISMYNNSRKIKLSLALARGKKKFDKRESIKHRDIEKDLGRKLKN